VPQLYSRNIFPLIWEGEKIKWSRVFSFMQKSEKSKL
jgi:hypothetical protein